MISVALLALCRKGFDRVGQFLSSLRLRFYLGRCLPCLRENFFKKLWKLVNAADAKGARGFIERPGLIICAIRVLQVPMETIGATKGTVRRNERLGGLLNYYYREAA